MILAMGYLFDFLNVGILVLTTVIISTVEAFREPANTVLTPKVLERKYYENGIKKPQLFSCGKEPARHQGRTLPRCPDHSGKQ